MIRSRRRSHPGAALRRFTSRLGPPIPPQELLLQVAEALKTSLVADGVQVWTVEAEDLVLTVSVPHVGEGARIALGPPQRDQLRKPDVYSTMWAKVWLPALLADRAECSLRIAPVVNEGEPLGVIVIQRAENARAFSTADGTVLTELARHLGLSLHNERLRQALEQTLAEVRRANEDLRASRARVVEAADAERRRIERDLHDGAQQQLIALTIDLRRARDVLADNPQVAAERLDRAAEAAAAAISELADLAHGIYPPVLRDSGLIAALRVVVRRHRSPVELEAERFARLPAAVEAAVYFAVLEGMQNAAKHAPGAHVTVRISQPDGQVEFEIADDGPGFVIGANHRGQGMLNISDRVGALGGTVVWDSAPGAGTCVRGAVPVA